MIYYFEAGFFMTLFYFSEDELCSLIKDSFDFFEQINIESFSKAINELNVSYSDDQIGFIVPGKNNGFPKVVLEFFEKVELKSDYFFAIVVAEKNAPDSPASFLSFCEKNGVTLKYLNFFDEDDSIGKVREKGIIFRSEIGMFVSKISGTGVRRKISGIFSSVCNYLITKIVKKQEITSDNET